ncbi:hypothetical protein G7046_g418 [Stylonectria norvegica]|nr:hypothetical protein G7046_g418 [Stylonectria norvegica]
MVAGLSAEAEDQPAKDSDSALQLGQLHNLPHLSSHQSLFPELGTSNSATGFVNPTESNIDTLQPSDHCETPGTQVQHAGHTGPSVQPSTRTPTGSLHLDQTSSTWSGWTGTDLDLFDLGGNAFEPFWLVDGCFDINALTSSISATGSPWGFSELPTNFTQPQAGKLPDGASGPGYPAIDDSNSIRNIVRSRWYTRPAVETTHPYKPSKPGKRDHVDEAYRADLSNRLRPSLQDNVLPSTDFLNTCIKLYFAKFQPILPIVHAPSFRPSSENALLLLSICSVGALFVGSPSAVARGRGIFMKLNKAILASWEGYLYRGGHEVLAVLQAVVLGQTFGMLSSFTNDLLLTESFHGTLIAWARQAGIFQVKDSLQRASYVDTADLETSWKTWSHAEETVRVLLALHIHDSEFATIFHHEPLLRHEPQGKLPRCYPEDLFAASTAGQWHDMVRSWQSPQSSSKQQDVGVGISIMSNSHAFMNIYALLAGHLAAICEARCGDLDDLVIEEFRYRLTSWYEKYSPSIRHPSRDPHCLMVLWHESFMSLYVSFELIERGVGCEEPSINDKDLARIRCWVAELEGQRCVIHAMLIYKRLQALPISTEPAIHVPKALFYAGLVLYCHAKFRSTKTPLGDIDIPELQSSDLGAAEPITASLRQFDSSTLYSVADLLRRQGHWELSRRFASILDALIDDLGDFAMDI